MEITTSKVDDVCRLCLQGDGNVSVFDIDCNLSSITPEKIYDCVSVKIGRDDKLPTVVCGNCIKHVENWCSFKSICDKTQTTLMKWLLCNSLDDSPKEELIEVSSSKTNDCEDNYVNAASKSDIVEVENQNGATNGVFADSKSSNIPVDSVSMKLNLKDLVLENRQDNSNLKTVLFFNDNEDGNSLADAPMETGESESAPLKNVESSEKEKSVQKLTETTGHESPSVSNIVIASTTTLPIEEFNQDEQSECGIGAKDAVTRAKDRSIVDLAAMFKPTEDPEEDVEEDEDEDGATGEENHSSSETANDPRIPVRYIKQEPVEYDETLEDDIPASLNLVPVKSEHYRMHHEEFLTPDDSMTRAAEEEEEELMMLAEEEACDGYEPASGESENLQCLLCDLSFTSLGSLYQHMSTRLHEQKAMAAAAASANAHMLGGNASMGGRNHFLPPGSARHLYTDPGFARDPSYYDEPLDGPTGFRGFSVADSYHSNFNLLPPPQESYRCKVCAVSFKKRFDYHRHTLTKKHRRNKKMASFASNPNIVRSPFICPMEDCNFSSIEGMKLLHHMKLHGISKPNQIPTSIYNRDERFHSRGSGHDMRPRKINERNMFGGGGWTNQEAGIMSREREHAQMIPSPVQSPSISGSRLPMLNCRYCDRVFRNEGGLTKHQTICSVRRATRHVDSETKIICKRCNLSFTSKNVYMNHMQIYHKEDGSQVMPRLRKNAVPSIRIKKGHFYVCNQCGKKFTLLSSWSFHMKQHAQQKNTVGKFSCKICNKVFRAKSTYRDHFRSHFVAPGSKELFCHKCFKVLPNRSELNLHKAGRCPSSPQKLLSCDICQCTYTDINALNKHKLTHQMPIISSTPTANASYNKSNLSLVPPQLSSSPKVQAFSNDYPRCDFCDRHYSNLGNLVKHMKAVHPEENLDGIRSKYAPIVEPVKRPTQWICKHCNAVRGNRRYLVPHLRSCKFNIFRHKEGVCIQCGKDFVSAKYKICPECLPEGALGRKKQPGELAMLLEEAPLKPNPQVLKQKPMPPLKLIPQVQKSIPPPMPIPQIQKPTFQVLNQKPPEFIKEKPIAKKELPKVTIPLYKCPNGNRYFLKEVYISKHLRICTGNCYPMCGNCRREFGNINEYREHLVTSKKCYRRKSVNKKSVEFVTQEDDSYGDEEASVNESSVAPSDGSMVAEVTLGARTCTFCFKNLHMQRNIYRHLYTCVKALYVAKENITCGRCGRVFGRVSSMKELAAQVKGHILDCYFVPYYEGEDVLPNGCPAPPKPPLVCYVCAFGFTSEVNLQKHIKDHRYKKDEVNLVVYRLEDLYKPPDEKFQANWVHQAQIHNNSLPILPASSDPTSNMVRQTKKKCINIIRDYVTQDSLDRKEESKAFFKCDLCDRKFTTRGKLKNHKEAHENYLMTHGDHFMKEAGSSSFLSLTY